MVTLLCVKILAVVFLCKQAFIDSAVEECSGDPEYSILGMMLQRHIYKTITGAPLGIVCLRECYRDFRCQSFNYVISKETCAMNNRTKEARPEDFVPNLDRYYFKRDVNRVRLGSIPELPAKSCREIKASEGEWAVNGNYWIHFLEIEKILLAYCDMKKEDTDECSLSKSFCDQNAACKNTRGSYRCLCKTGFTGDGKTCSDIDECSTNSHSCDANAVCSNIRGSYTCKCKAGFSGDGKTCSDIDECSTNSHSCDVNAVCSNIRGSYTCKCKAGYSGDGKTCKCKAGFSGDGKTCSDINECVSGAHDCHSVASCTNTVGSFSCSCNHPYTGDGKTCRLVAECQNYQSLTGADRKVTYYKSAKCDNGLGPGWFRFQGAAGTRMPTTCLPTYKCNTLATSWLNGGHPTVADGKVTRQVCFHWSSNCCWSSTNIQVRNCGSFYVYYFSGTPACKYRYCGTD